MVTYAPGQSAFNIVERRMAPLSKEMCGLILPHDYFGSHLNSKGETVDDGLEVRNFRKAAEVLAEVWTGHVIDGHVVTAVTSFGQDDADATYPSEVWIRDHVSTSQYMLQIRKCSDRRCCTLERSNITQVLGKFVPGPVKVQRAANGLELCKPGTDGLWLSLPWRLSLDLMLEQQSLIHPLPFDYFCSNRDTISKRYCKLCAMYFVTQAALKRHKKEKICKTTNVECWLHDEDVQLEQSEQLELEGRLKVSVEEVVDVEAVQTATRRNVFDLFDNLFEECTE